MQGPFTITYTYQFRDGSRKTFPLLLDGRTLRLTTEQLSNPPLWALLNENRCQNCPLDAREHTYCPVALGLAGIVERFGDLLSHETVKVTVTTEERTYAKETSIQQGLSPLLGILMTTSGCPVMEQLKPMVRFHLPFASLTETTFRMVTMHLVAQYLRHQEGTSAAWTLDGLAEVYAEVGQVNRDFAQRMRAAAKKDANVNALVILDCFATMVPLAAQEMLKEIKPYFASYLRKETTE